MRTPEQILITHDFSSCSRRALDYAVEIAAQTGSELHILHVEVLHNQSLLSDDAHKTKAQILREHLKKEIHDSAEKQDLLVSDINALRFVVLRNVSAASAIVEYCGDYNIDLVIMGTHGRHGLARNLLGSVAEEVVRLAPSSVLTVHDQDPFVPLHEHLNRITVPVDFSNHSRIALEYAKDMAAAFDATLDIVHVIEERLHPAFYNTGVFTVYDLEPDIESRLHSELETFYQETGEAPPEATYTILYGNPSKKIVQHIKDQNSDLLVIATHGLRGIKRALMGSVAERVVRNAPCPVLTVKNTEPSFKTLSPFAARREKVAS